jgi:hypothetical protein
MKSKQWAGRCDCGQLGFKRAGIITCQKCVEWDERAGYGCCGTRGPSREPKPRGRKARA